MANNESKRDHLFSKNDIVISFKYICRTEPVSARNMPVVTRIDTYQGLKVKIHRHELGQKNDENLKYSRVLKKKRTSFLVLNSQACLKYFINIQALS